MRSDGAMVRGATVRSEGARARRFPLRRTLPLYCHIDRNGPSHHRTGPSHHRTGPSHLRPVAPSDRT